MSSRERFSFVERLIFFAQMFILIMARRQYSRARDLIPVPLKAV